MEEPGASPGDDWGHRYWGRVRGLPRETSEPVQDVCQVFILFLCLVQKLYKLYYSKELPRNYASIIQEFRYHFDNMYSLEFLTETPKIHILYSHLEDYLDIQAKKDTWSLALADCQGLEACHSGLRKSDRRHNCDVKHHQVGCC